MNMLGIDHIIVYVFLFITLIVGLLAGRGIKDMREYAIANKQFGTGVLTMTILATYITGNKGIGYVGYVFEDGILPVFSVIGCGAIITFLFVAWCIAPKIQYFKGCLTLPELMGQLYGQRARFWMGILGTCYSIALVTLQMIWLGHIGVLLDLPSQLSILLGGLFLVLYAARGGIKAVAITDVVQFIAILVFVPLVAYVVLYHVGGIRTLFNQVPKESLDVLHHPSLKDYVVYCIWDLWPAFPLSFPFIQRMLMARDKPQLVNSYYVGLSFLTVFYLLLTLIGLAAIVLHTTVDTNMPQQGSNVFVYIVKHYLPKGAQGIIGAGFIAGVMSTADSFLHTAGLALVHDVIQPRLKRNVDTLRLTRLLTLLLGLIALASALTYKELPRIQYGGLDLGKGLNFITEIIALVFTVPLVAGIMGLKTDARSFFVSSGVTVVIFVLSRYFLSHELIIPVAVATNVLSFFGMHYFQHKGFAVVKRAAEQQTAYIWHPTREGIRNRLAKLLPTPKKLLSYSQNRIDKYGANPTLFALFIALSYMVPFFMHSYAEPGLYNWLLAIRGMGALLCVGLLLQAYWPKQLQAYFPSYYHLTLLYCLPFVTTFLFLLEGGSIEWLLNVTLSIMLLIVLVDWVSFILLTVLGVALGLLCYVQVVGPINLQLNFNIGYALVYTCIFATLIALLFARRKEQFFEAQIRAMGEHHATRSKVEAYTHPATLRIANMIDKHVHEILALYHPPSASDTVVLQEGEPTTEPDFLHYFFPTALEVIKQGPHLSQHVLQVIKEDYMAPHVSLFSLQACVATILESYGRRHPHSMHVSLSEDYWIYTSFNHLQYALTQVIRFLHAHHRGVEHLSLWIQQQEGIHIRLSGQVLPPSLVHALCALFPPQETTKHLGLAISSLLLEAHGGHLLCKTHALPEDPYTEFIISIPPAEVSALANLAERPKKHCSSSYLWPST